MNTAFYSVCTFAYGLFSAVVHPFTVVGRENVPMEGKVIICANHQSAQDPMALATYVKRKIFFMAKKEAFSVRLFGKVLSALGAFPVARGENDINAIRTSFRLLKEEKALGIFPEGHRFTGGEMQAAQNGASMIALRSGAAVIPARISGNYKPFKRMRLIIGKPVELGDLNGKCDANTLSICSERIRKAIMELA